MAQDRPDLSLSACLASTRMSSPRLSDRALIKRIIRYVRGRPTSEYHFPWRHVASGEHLITLYSDSDWATDTRGRKSRSGGVLMLGPHCVHHWGKQQDRIALSSGEAELKATCKGLSEFLGMAQIMNFFTRQSQALEHRMDASATERMVLRQGSGQLKHSDIRELWVQAAVVEHGIKVVKIPRTDNYADILCSVPRKEEFNAVLTSLGFHFPNPCHGQGGEIEIDDNDNE